MAKRINYNVFEKSDVRIMTNKLDISVNVDAFFSRYAIVSYFITGKESGNLSYEQLSEVPCLAVFGKYAEWNIQKHKWYIKFFVLCRKGVDAVKICDSLKEHKDVIAGIDHLDNVSEEDRRHVIVSLLLNSLGTEGKGQKHYMFNDARLLLWDERNFLQKFKKTQEIVCLQIGIDKYSNLTAQTCTLSRVTDAKLLKSHQKRVFVADYDIEGYLWAGRSIRPVKIDNRKNYDLEKERFFIQHKRFTDEHNQIPYWPYDRENYRHGKLFAMWQVVQTFNARFEGIAVLAFQYFEDYTGGVFKTENIAKELMVETLAGKVVRIDNPLKDEYSKEFAKEFLKLLKKQVPEKIKDDFTIETRKGSRLPDAVIKIVQEKGAEGEDHYERYIDRLYNNMPYQHLTCHKKKSEDKLNAATAKRILLELVVKISNDKERMPQSLIRNLPGWTFIEYKRNAKTIVGARMDVNPDGLIHYENLGALAQSGKVLFEDFVRQTLMYHDPNKLKGHQDYKVLIKDSNVYLIIDTEEIPMLNAELIEMGYDKVLMKGISLSYFKRNENAPHYFGAYKGLHVWRTDDLDGNRNGAFSYIAGFNGETIRMMDIKSLDKMPRARRIFPLHLEHREVMDSDVEEILRMLDNGFGRWNEVMTYPYPFKFLSEYLDNSMEIKFSMHWNEVTVGKGLIDSSVARLLEETPAD